MLAGKWTVWYLVREWQPGRWELRKYIGNGTLMNSASVFEFAPHLAEAVAYAWNAKKIVPFRYMFSRVSRHALDTIA